MTYCYPGLGGKPIIIACIECLLTGKGFWVQMLLDTGADNSCFPASLAAAFGHSNAHPGVEVHKNYVQGVGGFSDAYIHSVRVNLLHPSKSTSQKPVIAWSSALDKIPFIDRLDCGHCLIGMDIIREWKGLTIEPNKHGLLIKITV